jgi:hypothetical protein
LISLTGATSEGNEKPAFVARPLRENSTIRQTRAGALQQIRMALQGFVCFPR